jgi:hypothetical protein
VILRLKIHGERQKPTKASVGFPMAKIPEFKAGFELLSFMV